MTQLIFGIVATVCAFLLAYTLTPAVRVLAFKIGAVDVPLDGRRIHSKPIPRIGGLAIYLAFLLTTLLFCDFTDDLLIIWVGGAILVVLGILDDIYRLNAWLKLIIQFATATYAVLSGCVIEHINLGGVYVDLGVLSIPLSILWIAGLTNAINFIDGLDGLACGVSAISSLSMLVVVLLHGNTVSTVICAILFGSCLGFLPFNSNPARIFMGDTGALFLGFSLAILSVQGVFKMHAVLAFIVPITIFALPIFDTAFAIFRRLFSGKSPFAADRGHIHHRLIDIGFTQKETVKILYAICGILGLVAVVSTDAMFSSTRVVRAAAIFVIAIVIFVMIFLIMKHPSARKHSGLCEDETTVAEYIRELPPEKVKKVEEINGGDHELVQRIIEEEENRTQSLKNDEAGENASVPSDGENHEPKQ